MSLLKKNTFDISDKANCKTSPKEMHSYEEQHETVTNFKTETANVKDTSSTLTKFSETTGFAINENVWGKSELNMTYMVAGVGFVVFLLLILIVIQLFRKPGYAKRKSLTKTLTVNQLDGELTNRNHNRNDQNYLEILGSQQINHSYQHAEAVYLELDDCAEQMETPTYSNTTTYIECQTNHLQFKQLNSLETRNEYVNSQHNDF